MTGPLGNLSILSFMTPDYEMGGPPVMFYQAMFNPETYTVKHQVNYSSKQAEGSDGKAKKFKSVEPKTYTFDFLIDGTGSSGKKREVFVDIELFKLATGYDGIIHQPRYVMLVWGTLFAKCVLCAMSIKYSLFRPDGTPLRAIITASFTETKTNLLQQLLNNLLSPDLTHVKTFKASDKLPNLAHEIYRDGSYYVEVARANQLNSIRKVKEGTKINLPPLEK